jgi:glucose-1-phosphate thymidylyltransferase
MGVPYFDEHGVMIKYVEKPQDPPHDFAVPGVYFGDNNFFKCFKGKDRLKPSPRGEYEIPDAFQWMIDHGYKVEVVEYKGKWLDPGKFDDWLETNQYLLDKNVQSYHESQPGEGSKIEGRVNIGENTTIINSTIRGPVSIGDNVTIKNSFIGPYTSIYHNCHIGKTHLENSVLMEKVKLNNITKPIQNSIIGTEAEISGEEAKHYMSLFVSELSHIKL